MSATATSLRELHGLHQRAKALRDRLSSGPKTLAARQAALANKQAALEAAKKALQDEKVQLKKSETILQGQQTKVDDLKVKLNLAKKNDEYKAIQNQIAHDKKSMENTEGNILEGMDKVEEKIKALAVMEAEVKAFADEVAKFQAEIEANAASQKAQLADLEKAIVDAEGVIPEDYRAQYARIVKHRGAEALASVESGACTGCFVSVTAQMMNELINANNITFCMTCGRVLYLAEEDVPTTKRTKGK